jgi:hypothetical protein
MHERAAEGRGCVAGVAGVQWLCGGVDERGWLSAASKLAIVRDFGVICFHNNCRAGRRPLQRPPSTYSTVLNTQSKLGSS